MVFLENDEEVVRLHLSSEGIQRVPESQQQEEAVPEAAGYGSLERVISSVQRVQLMDSANNVTIMEYVRCNNNNDDDKACSPMEEEEDNDDDCHAVQDMQECGQTDLQCVEQYLDSILSRHSASAGYVLQAPVLPPPSSTTTTTTVSEEKQRVPPPFKRTLSWMSNPQCEESIRSAYLNYEMDLKKYKIVNDSGLLNGSCHRSTPLRLRWLFHWITGSPKLDSGEQCSMAEQFERECFLRLSLEDKEHFQPFTILDEANQRVRKNPSGIIIRLSGTVPGNISVTWWDRSKCMPQNKRFNVESRHCIKDYTGSLCFRSLLELAQYLRQALQPSSTEKSDRILSYTPLV